MLIADSFGHFFSSAIVILVSNGDEPLEVKIRSYTLTVVRGEDAESDARLDRSFERVLAAEASSQINRPLDEALPNLVPLVARRRANVEYFHCRACLVSLEHIDPGLDL